MAWEDAMHITRRSLLGGLAAAPLIVPGRARALATFEADGIRLDLVSDGNLVLPRELVFAPVPQAVAKDVASRFGLGESLTPDCTLTLYRYGTNVVLFDAGSGPAFQPTAGQMLDDLSGLGVDPADVTHLVLTHAHPDHLWGVVDDFEEPLFPNAVHLIGRVEHDYWRDPATVETIGAERQAFAVGASRRLEQVADLLETFEDGEEVAEGITARLTPGHTPGHMSFDLTFGGEPLTVLGDAVANHHVALAHPMQETGQDQDPPLAARTRTALLDDLADSGARVVGFHFPHPGVGRIVREGEGFAFAPEA